MFCIAIVVLDVRDSKSEIEIEMLETLLNAKDAERCCERQRQSQKWSEGERERVWGLRGGDRERERERARGTEGGAHRIKRKLKQQQNCFS